MTLFDRIKKIAKAKGYSLSEVSRRSGIGEKSIYTWKPSKTYPDGIVPKHETLQKVANVLGVSVDYLLGNTEDKHASKNDDMPLDLEETLSKLGPAVAFEGKELTDDQKLKLYEMAKVMFGD